MQTLNEDNIYVLIQEVTGQGVHDAQTFMNANPDSTKSQEHVRIAQETCWNDLVQSRQNKLLSEYPKVYKTIYVSAWKTTLANVEVDLMTEH